MKDQGEFRRTVLSGVKRQVWMMHLVDSGDMYQQRGMICTLYVYIMCTFRIMHTWYGIVYIQYYAYAENIHVYRKLHMLQYVPKGTCCPNWKS